MNAAAKLGVLDYGVGTWSAVVNMVESLGEAAESCTSADEIFQFSHIVLPGVGNFGPAALKLKGNGWVEAIQRFALSGRPVLGICLGMQLLGEASDESEGAGLNILPFVSEKLSDQGPFKVPHMGWNKVRPEVDHPIFKDWDGDSRFYFVHSFAVPDSARDRAGTTNHNQSFSSVVARDNVVGVQFHPEKSRRYGMNLFQNFLEM